VWKNAQTYLSQDIEGFPIWGTTNGPNANAQGLELFGRYNVAEGWQVQAGTTYTHATWVGTKTVCLYTNNTECRTYNEGGELGGSPKNKHMLGVRWDTALAGGASLNASLRAKYTSAKASDRADVPGEAVFAFKSYTLLNANVGMTMGAWDVNLWADNVTDKRALASFQGTSAVAVRTGLRAMYVTPRTVGLNVSYNFK
jgi:iron complex outermembrane recepter protein